MCLCCCCVHEGGRLTLREEELVKSGAIMTRLLSKERTAWAALYCLHSIIRSGHSLSAELRYSMVL